MAARLAPVGAILCLLLLAAPSFAQVSDEADLLLMSESLLSVAQQTQFAVTQPAMADSLQRCVVWISRSGAGGLKLRDAARMAMPVQLTLPQRLRWKPQDFVVEAGAEEVDPELLAITLNAILEIINTPGGLHDHLEATLGTEVRIQALELPMQLYGYLVAASLETSFVKLERYERKFGPGSARLNLVEVGLNMALSPVPGFGPDAEQWPGPWEAVAAYSTHWLGVTESEAFVGSLLQLGLRHYNFTPGWGEAGGWRALLTPSQFSFGVALAGEEDAPLIWPLRGEERWGAFLTWGSIEIAYLFGDEGRWLISRQFQFLPALF